MQLTVDGKPSIVMIYDIVIGALSGGVNFSTLALLNIVLALTFGSLLLLAWNSTVHNPALLPHVAILLVLALGLTISINWFVSNIGLADPNQQKKELFGNQEGSTAEPISEEKVEDELEEKKPAGKRRLKQA